MPFHAAPRRPLAALLTFALAAAVPAAVHAAVPPAGQATMFDKVFGFDRALDRSSLQVLIVRHEASAAALAAVEQAFRAAGLRAELVPPAAVSARLAPGVVVYLTPDTASPALLAEMAEKKVLSISGDPALVESGRAAVALEDAGGRQQIVVNLDRVAAEGHDFTAQMLKVSRVVRAGGAGAPAGANSTVTPPVLVNLNKPPYPEMARRLRVEGDVVMRLQVDASGKVTGVELLRGLAKGGIDEAAVAAARTARFKPATLDGRAVAGSYTLTLPFRL